MRARLVVLVSGVGTNLQALIDACAGESYGAAVAAVGADRSGIEGLARLARYGSGMALSKAHGMGIDLKALRDLHFRFISFSADLSRSKRRSSDFGSLPSS